MPEEHGKRAACSPTLFEAVSISATRDKMNVLLPSARKHIERVQKILCFSSNVERIPAFEELFQSFCDKHSSAVFLPCTWTGLSREGIERLWSCHHLQKL